MLVALSNGVRVTATEAEKGGSYHCPACKAELVLRKGAIKIHHFAHRPPVDCAWGSGETLAHLEAKQLIHAAFAPRAFRAEMEWPVEGLSGDRRADVFVWDMRGAKVAFELQHTAIGAGEMAKRSAAYMAAGIAVLWLPFLRARYRAAAERPPAGEDGDWLIRPYAPRPFERWLDLFHHHELWFWAPRSGKVMRGRLESLGAGQSQMALRLWGPYDPGRLALRAGRRKAVSLARYDLPGGPSVRLELPG